MKKQPRGYLALMAAIIISVVLLGLATAIGQNTFFSRFNALNREYKRISLGLAESCVHAALAKISNNYEYRIQDDPDYDPEYDEDTAGVVVELGEVYGRETTCLITGPTSQPAEVNGKKTFEITTKASYAGAYSTLAVSATAQDPETAPVVPPPSCALAPTSVSVPSGQSFSFSWNSTGADTMIMNRGVGTLGLPDGTRTITPTAAPGTYEYEATVTNLGGTNTCSIDVTVTPPPPEPACADTVMMLDRSLSMFGYPDYPSGYTQWIPNEKTAAKTLVDLYGSVSSNPKVGFGRIGDLSSGRGAEIVTTLTNAYASLKSAIDNGLPQSPTGYTNLGQAISVARTELGSVRHDPDKEKVLVFVSDGMPNEPSGSVDGNTGWHAPTSNAANGSGDAWTDPANVYGVGSATEAEGDRHRYADFGFTFPAGALIEGIEIGANAQTSAAGPSAILSESFGDIPSILDIPNWDEEGSDSDSSTQALAPGSGNDSASPNGGRFARIGQSEWICRELTATNLSSLILSYYWRGDTDAEGNDDLVIEYHPTSTNCATGSGWSTITTQDLNTNTGSWTQRTNVALPGALNGDSSFLLRVRANTSSGDENGRIDGITLTGTAPACNLGVDLSWNGGSSWTSERTMFLTSTPDDYTLGTQNDTWGRSWSTNELGNGNFRVRVRATSAASTCSLDTLTARVSYGLPTNPTQYARDAANAAKAADVSIFSIHFGDLDGLGFMQELASPSSLPNSTIVSASRSGGSATITTAAAHRLTRNQRVQISGVGSGAFNGTFTVTSVTSPTVFRYTLSGTTLNATGGSVNPLNLFVSPNSSDMQGIFQSIGYQVCPAAANQCSNTIDDDGDGLVDDADGGCHTDGVPENIGSYDPDDTDEWITPIIPTPPLPPPPPPNITIGSWLEVP